MASICPYDDCDHEFKKVDDSKWTDFLMHDFKCPTCSRMVSVEMEYGWGGPTAMWLERSDATEPSIEYAEELVKAEK